MTETPPCPLVTEAGAADLDAVMTIMAAAFDPRFGEAWTRAQCAGILGLPGVWLLLARTGRDEAVANGFALVRAILDEAELLLLAVAPVDRRRGVGSALIAGVIDSARTRGVHRLHLEMRENNPAATLYESVGFQQVGRRARYYQGHDGRRYDAVTLALDLPREG